jgi:hypothetical protein
MSNKTIPKYKYERLIRMKKQKKKTAKDILNEVMLRLSDLEPYIFHKALTGSIYIKFKNENLRSLRIADHTGRKKYRYKWNLIIDGETREEKDRGIARYYYSDKDMEKMANHMIQYSNKILENQKAKQEAKDVEDATYGGWLFTEEQFKKLKE